MRVGLIHQLHGRPGGDLEPRWATTREAAVAAEDVGFDMFVFEDALMYKGVEHTDGCWESMTIAGALAASTSTIRLGQSVINAPYRNPALTASMANTLDEVSAGRYVLGIGAGNTPNSDYEGFGFPTDHRYSRFAEAIEIITGLLRSGHVDVDGVYHSAKGAELGLRGPSPAGPEVNIAAGGPRMLGLVARYGDAWNWWAWDEAVDDAVERLRSIVERLEDACHEADRDPLSIRRTLDIYTVTPPGLSPDESVVGGFDNPISGTATEIAERLARFADLGFDEVRLDLTVKERAGIEAMSGVVDALHTL